jgi:hypothetical protein
VWYYIVYSKDTISCEQRQLTCDFVETLRNIANSLTQQQQVCCRTPVPEAAWRGPLESRAVGEQVPVQMQANVGLKALGKPLQNAVHVDAVCVRPGVLQTVT